MRRVAQFHVQWVWKLFVLLKDGFILLMYKVWGRKNYKQISPIVNKSLNLIFFSDDTGGMTIALKTWRTENVHLFLLKYVDITHKDAS